MYYNYSVCCWARVGGAGPAQQSGQFLLLTTGPGTTRHHRLAAAGGRTTTTTQPVERGPASRTQRSGAAAQPGARPGYTEHRTHSAV